jgi:hypothetical protein
MKRLWIPLFPAVLATFALVPARYSIQPQTPVIASNLGNESTSTVFAVLLEAHSLLNRYGSRPYWPNLPYKSGEDVPADQAPDVVAHIIPCESQDVSVKHLDSNDFYSYGVGQIQSSTWAQFESQSGLSGSPMWSPDAVRMMLWAVENGYLDKWSCASLTRLI